MSEVIDITDTTFEEEVIKSETPVLVDYWAKWCGPCKMISPILENLAETYKEKLKICKLNIDENVNTPAKYNIRGIPTLMIVKNGNIESIKVGALTKEQLIEFIDSCISA